MKVRTYIWRNPERFFPPGYEYEKVYRRLVLLWGIAVIYSIRFFFDYYEAYQWLFEWTHMAEASVGMQRVLVEGRIILPFFDIVPQSFLFFVPLFFVLFTEMVLQYLYYFQESRSILLVRRLRDRAFIFRTCVAGPALGMMIVGLSIVLLIVLYYGVYVCFTPAGHLP